MNRPLNLYQIVLPVEDNHGNSYEFSHSAFRGFLLDKIGGYTMLPNAGGGWQKEDGTEVLEPVTPYLVAAPPYFWPRILEEVDKLFPDQLAIFWAELGKAHLHIPHHPAAEVAQRNNAEQMAHLVEEFDPNCS